MERPAHLVILGKLEILISGLGCPYNVNAAEMFTDLTRPATVAAAVGMVNLLLSILDEMVIPDQEKSKVREKLSEIVAPNQWYCGQQDLVPAIKKLIEKFS